MMQSMTGEAPVYSSKPKIHRLPASPPLPRKMRVLRAFLSMPLDRKVFALCGFAGAMMLSAVFIQVAKTVSSGENAIVSPASAATFAHLSHGATSEKKPEKSIVISDTDGAIVGQMAKIPAQNEQVTDIKTMTEVDNRAGRDLLSVINKY